MSGDGAVMSFREHLMELRTRLVRMAAVLTVGVFVFWGFRLEFFDFLSRPIAQALADNGIYHFQAIQITESIAVYVKVALFGELLFLSPYLFWEVWGFVAPGLYPREKRFILPLVGFSVVFFVIGAGFAYTVLLPFITDWLVQLSLEGGHVEVMVTLQSAYSFALAFLLMFGLVFELPLVIFFLALFGVASGKGLLKFWRYFVVISFIASGILTPPDPISQVMMAVPLNALYGLGILVAFSVSRAREKNEGKGASMAAVRVLGLSLMGVVAVAVAVALVIASIPERALVGYTPDTARFAVGLNPKTLLAEGDLKRAIGEDAGAARVVAALGGAGVALDEVVDALLVGDDDQLALLVRGDGFGALSDAVEAALAKDRPAGAPTARDVLAARLSDDTLVVGHRNLVSAVLDVGYDVSPRLARGEEDDRLLRRLSASGPAWVWLPNPRERSEPLLGLAAATDIDTAGAVLSLTDHRQLAVHLHAANEGETDVLDGHLQTARDQALADQSSARLDRVVRAVRELSQVVARLSPAETQAEVDRIAKDVAGLDRRSSAAIPAFDALAPFVRAWSIRRNESWFVVTTELDDDALPALVAMVADGARVAAAP